MPRAKEEAKLRGLVEVAAHEFQATAVELRSLAESLPRRARASGTHLESVAIRLESVASQLGTEVMLSPDPGFSLSALKLGRTALAMLTVSLGLVAKGALEEVGSDVHDAVVAAVARAEDAADAAESELLLAPEAFGAEVPADPAPAEDDFIDEPLSFSGTQAAKVTGISYRQLDYWARTDLIRPSVSDATGSGTSRRYSYGDLLELKTIKTLLDAGVRLEQVRNVFSQLRDRATSVETTNVVLDGTNVTLAENAELVGLLSRGVSTKQVLSLGSVLAALEADLAVIHGEL